MQRIISPFLVLTLMVYHISALPGRFDPTFDGDGRILYDPLTFFSVNDLAIQADGKVVVVARRTADGTSNSDFFVIRFNKDGSLDTGFGNNGSVQTDTNPNGDFGADTANAVAIQPDGKIVVAGSGCADQGGTCRGGAVLVRYNSDGTLDANFGNGGISGHNFSATQGTTAEDVAIAADGRIFTVGEVGSTGGSDAAIVMFNADGSVNSELKVVAGTSTSEFRGAAVQPDGSLIAVGIARDSGDADGDAFAVARISAASGLILDNTFGGTGVVKIEPGDEHDEAEAVALQTDGKIVVTGMTDSSGSSQDFCLTRINPDGTLDGNFGIGGIVKTPVHQTARDRSTDVAIQPDGKIVSVGIANVGGGNDDYTVVRHRKNGTIDSQFGSNGLKTFSLNGSSTELATGVKIDGEGRIVVVGQSFIGGANYKIGIARLKRTHSFGDFDGEGRTDVAIFRPSVGEWWYLRSSDSGVGVFGFGVTTDIPVPFDFTGDERADVAVFRPSDGNWYILRSEDSTYYSFPFGVAGDLPVAGYFDTDDRADTAIYRPSTGQWFILRSSDQGVTAVSFGVAEDKPVVADYDGDGLDDVSIFRPSVREWWILNSGGGVSAYQFGTAGDRTVQGDWTGDGRADVAVWRPTTGEWFVLRSEDNSFFAFPFGANGDVPVPGDYDGDGILDAAVWRQSQNNTWYILGSTSGFYTSYWGQQGDIALPGTISAQ